MKPDLKQVVCDVALPEVSGVVIKPGEYQSVVKWSLTGIEQVVCNSWLRPYKGEDDEQSRHA